MEPAAIAKRDLAPRGGEDWESEVELLQGLPVRVMLPLFGTVEHGADPITEASMELAAQQLGRVLANGEPLTDWGDVAAGHVAGESVEGAGSGGAPHIGTVAENSDVWD